MTNDAALSWAVRTAQEVVDLTLRAGADDAEVSVTRRGDDLTRFARSQIHQDVTSSEVVVQVRAMWKGAAGWATTGRVDIEGLERVIEHALAVARHSKPPAIPIALPMTGTGVLVPSSAMTAPGPEDRARTVRIMIGAVPDRLSGGVELHGLVETVCERTAVANSRGLLSAGIRPSTWVVVLARADDGGSGYAEQRASILESIDVEELARSAARTAATSASPLQLPRRDYTVVLSEYAVADLAAKTARLTFTGAALLAGSSAFQAGVTLGSPLVSLHDDGNDRSGVPRPFDAEGVPRRRVDLVTAGRFGEVVHDSATAAARGTRSTGHALPLPDRVGPLATNLFLDQGTGTLDELVATVDDGLLINRLYYSNALDQRRTLMTGSTRDGVYRIRNGEVAEAVADARFEQSYLEALGGVRALSAGRRTVSGWYGGVNLLGDVTVPAAVIEGFRVGAVG